MYAYIEAQEGEEVAYLSGDKQERPGLLLSQKAQLKSSEFLKEKPFTGI